MTDIDADLKKTKLKTIRNQKKNIVIILTNEGKDWFSVVSRYVVSYIIAVRKSTTIVVNPKRLNIGNKIKLLLWRMKRQLFWKSLKLGEFFNADII